MSGARVDVAFFAPPADLAAHVEVLWAGWWDLRGDTPHTSRLLPDPCVNIAFEGDESRVVGVWTRTWSRTLEGRGSVRAAKLAAGAVGAFLDADAADLANRLTPLADVAGPDAGAELRRRVLDPARAEAGCAAVARWLRSRRRDPLPDGVATAMEACRLAAGDPSLLTVEALARAVDMSPRALQRLFRRHVGGSPKWLIRRHRLQEAAARIERGEDGGLAGLAAELGYADQAHLTRDFTAAVGASPARFARDVHR
ncbi:MAG: helix-turn-helix transcriptional regulator [Thermoleophilia bacterium]|nr:helix-turn-helix transcriptional regulator [Thermoleophilia bacterium]